MNEPRIRRKLPAFEVLAELGRRDPEALQALGRLLTDDVIKHAPRAASRRRLEGLKFRIEMERRRSPDPLAACVRLSKMMHRVAVGTAHGAQRARTAIQATRDRAGRNRARLPAPERRIRIIVRSRSHEPS